MVLPPGKKSADHLRPFASQSRAEVGEHPARRGARGGKDERPPAAQRRQRAQEGLDRRRRLAGEAGHPTPTSSPAVASRGVATSNATVRAPWPASRNAVAIVSATVRVLPLWER